MADRSRAAWQAVDVSHTGDANKARASWLAVDVSTPLEEQSRTAWVALDVSMTSDQNRSRADWFALDVSVTDEGTLPDPPFADPANVTLTGGTVGREITSASEGRWLLDIDMGGQLWRFSDFEVTPISRIENKAVVYYTGMSDITVSVDATTVTVTVRAADPAVWADSRRRLGPLRGRRFTLRRWYERTYLEDAFLVLQGVIEGANWGNPSDPTALQVSLARGIRELALEMVPATARVDSATWPGIHDNNIDGAPYPLPIGYPGNGEASTPGLYVDTVQDHLLIAGARVAATDVWVHDLTSGLVEFCPVLHQDDSLGREIAYVDLGAASIVSGVAGHEYAIGWNTAGGAGVLHRGRAVVGLGDLLIYGATTFSTALHDHGELEARRTSLNRYQIGTFVNEPGVNFDDWLQRNVLGLFEIEAVDGPRGLYYREIKWTTDPSLVRGRIVTGTAGGGYRVERVSAVSDSDEDVANHITVDYAPYAASTDAYTRRAVIGASRESDDTTPDIACAASQTIYGRRELSWQTAMLSSANTAFRVAQTKAARHALPKQVAVYEGGRDLLDFVKWDVVQVHDTSPGADFRDAFGVVTGITFQSATTVRLAVRIDTDPLRFPTVAT